MTRAEVVAMNVTVVDGKQRHVRGLTRDDFAVLEDGAPQAIQFFDAGESAIDLALMLDSSASVAERLPTIKAAATGFVRTLRPNDRGSIVAFSDHPRFLQEWTNDRAMLERAIGGVKATGSTGLYTALYVTLKSFVTPSRSVDAVRRKAIVVLSDGEDTSSSLGFDDVLELSQRAGVSIYTIRLRSPLEGTAYDLLNRRTSTLTAEYVLRALSRETGARTFAPKQVQELAGVYGVIAEELANQYVLGYEPRMAPGLPPFRRLQVLVPRHSDASTRTRSGYYASSARSGSTSAASDHSPEIH